MYVCVCNAVTDTDIRDAVDQGSHTMKDLQQKLEVGTCCGRCARCAKNCLNQALSQESAFMLNS